MRHLILATALWLAAPASSVEDIPTLLRNLAKAAARTPSVPADVNAGTAALLKQSDQALVFSEWQRACRENMLKLSDDERAALWGKLVYMDAYKKRQPQMAEEMKLFHAAYAKHPAFASTLREVLDWEGKRGNPENVGRFLKDYGESLPAEERKKIQGRLDRFRAGAPPPALVGKDWEGKAFDLAALKGRAVLIYYWASG